ncbi:methyltransferase domain-containing protein [Candidatus Woesearchaeota archaeon]|nr:methyltransferase domain-containing protein [Candidatus Woesearchaeota archaeon]
MAKSILYWHPWIYKIGLLLYHGRYLSKRYEYISRQIGKNKVVLEPGCGPGILAKYLNKSCKYIGFDIDPMFVKYAKKKGLNVYKGDALSKKSYKRADAIVMSDFFHHIGRKDEKKVLKLCNQYAKKIIICEQPAPEIYKRIKLFVWIFNKLDQDKKGKVNLAVQRTKKELLTDMKKGFGIIKKRNTIKKIGKDYIATYG